jgi:hypothetical protein
MRFSAKTAAAVLALILLVSFFARRFPGMQKGTDFADFYAAARLVAAGHGPELYHPSLQDAYLTRYAGRVGTYYIHPPYETLLYLPFSLFSLSTAYALWCSWNAVLLIVLLRQLSSHLPGLWSWQILLALALLFVPLLLNFLQGQDSVILLFLLVSCFVVWRQKRDFLAGGLLALGLFKFHLVIPAAIALSFRSSRRFLGGLGSMLATLLAVSLGICGWRGLLEYPAFLGRLDTLPLAGIHPQAMANLRGLFATIVPQSPSNALILTGISSMLVLAVTIRRSWLTRSRDGAADMVLAQCVSAAILVGYHLSPHDLTILFLPMVVVAHHALSNTGISRRSRFSLLFVCTVLLLPPLYLLLLGHHVFSFVSCGLLIFFLLTDAEIRRLSSGPGDSALARNVQG